MSHISSARGVCKGQRGANPICLVKIKKKSTDWSYIFKSVHELQAFILDGKFMNYNIIELQ